MSFLFRLWLNDETEATGPSQGPRRCYGSKLRHQQLGVGLLIGHIRFSYWQQAERWHADICLRCLGSKTLHWFLPSQVGNLRSAFARQRPVLGWACGCLRWEQAAVARRYPMTLAAWVPSNAMSSETGSSPHHAAWRSFASMALGLAKCGDEGPLPSHTPCVCKVTACTAGKPGLWTRSLCRDPEQLARLRAWCQATITPVVL